MGTVMSEEQLFIEALEIRDPAQRTVFLETACAGRTTLLRRIEGLLQAHASAGEFLETPARQSLATDVTAEELSPGSVVGRYQIVRPLGEGGMGAVYLAHQIEPVRRQVALKLIRPGLVSSHVLARFEAERQALAMMDHPNIARVFDAGTTEQGQPYFVMELIEGSPIIAYCTAHNLSLASRLELLTSVCQAVQHAHQKGILHRDLKPGNILIVEYDGKPTPKVIDFGVAKVLGQPVRETFPGSQSRLFAGTLEYMAPELAQPDSIEIDSQGDVYSLGVLLYELVTGTTPLRQTQRLEGLSEILRVIREVPAPPPSGMPGSQPALMLAKASKLRRLELDAIAAKALSKNPNDRYNTALALGMDLQHYLTGAPVDAALPQAGYRVKKFLRRYRTAVLSSVASLAALVGVTIFSLDLAYRASRAEEAALRESDRATAERNRAYAAESTAAEERNKAVAAQKQAVEEAAAAKAVLDFLVIDLFLEADPQRNARTRQVTVEELMDRAAARLGGKFEHQPTTEAMIRQVMGVMYRKLGNLAAAQVHLERALELRQAHLGEAHDHTLNTMDALAVVYDGQQKKAQAEDLMRRSFDKSRELLGAEHVQTRMKMGNLGVVLLQSGKLEQAEPFLRQSYELNRSHAGDEDAATLVSLHNLAVLLMEQGKLDESEQLHLQTLHARQRVQGEEHPRSISSMHMLAVVYQFQGKHEQAQSLFQQTLILSQKVLGADHRSTLNTMRCLASNFEAMGQQTQAESRYRDVLRIVGQSHQEDAPLEAEVLLVLGHNLIRQKKYDEASKALQQSVNRWQGREQPAWIKTYHLLLTGVVLVEQQKHAEAASSIRSGCKEARHSLELSTRRSKLHVLSALEDVSSACDRDGFHAERDASRALMSWLKRELTPHSP